MPEYIVKTFENRNLVIEADHFEVANGALYSFFKESKLVASVPIHDVFAVVEENAFQDDFYYADSLDEDETDDVCSDFLESEEFFDAVYDAVAVILDDSESEVEHWINQEGDHLWGWNTEKGFVDFVNKHNAERSLEFYKNYENGTENWSYKDLTGYTKVED